MTEQEFLTVCLAPIEAAYGPVELFTARMYRSMLIDLDRDILAAATAKCIAEIKWLPKIAELRSAAVDIARGDVQEMTPTEAWGHALTAIRRIDFDVPGSMGRAKDRVPPLVWEAMQNVGLTALVNSHPQFMQKVFFDAYSALVSRERKLLLATPQVRRAIEAQRAAARLPISGLVGSVAGRSGCEP